MSENTVTPAKSTNTLALVGFILSLAGFVVGITAIPGIVLGHIGLSQIKKTGEEGHGLAVAALIMGYIQIGLAIIGIIVAVVVFAIWGASWMHNGGGGMYMDNALNALAG